ncbi:MAG: prepilin-type N-terminal cleavage/methylation domain-containing protein [Rhodocyclaceae bacterium]|nr:prepilin-type N-terminal cleavage/methylation domain-containing protein [Rhodocyclaceae bacterium]
MRSKQSGFTLIEIAIVLVIIGLLLGGVLKGQELINSAKVKNMATDFRNIPLFIYGYQDKFKALPGDDSSVATTHLGATVNGVTVVAATTPASSQGNGVINGAWNSATQTDESILFWQHVRLAGLAAGVTTAPTAANILDFLPKNADGGFIGITSGSNTPVTGLAGTYIVCSTSILGKYVKQLDVTMDDGNTETGSVRAIANVTALNATVVAAAAVASTAIVDATSYTVCMSL